ncbi:hypothetical protein BD309DRAFT_945424 [Dichomitus squalens]|nr:hypothetical protein BD309DRAFT_945424 [Dichomitus squalens]
MKQVCPSVSGLATGARGSRSCSRGLRVRVRMRMRTHEVRPSLRDMRSAVGPQASASRVTPKVRVPAIRRCGRRCACPWVAEE